jgi:hypothetical protein
MEHGGYWLLASGVLACGMHGSGSATRSRSRPTRPARYALRQPGSGRGQRAASSEKALPPPPTAHRALPRPPALAPADHQKPLPARSPQRQKASKNRPNPRQGLAACRLQLVAHHTAVTSPMEVLVAAPALARLRERQWGGCWQVVVSRRLFDSMAPSVSQAGMQGPCAPPLSHLHRLTSRRGIRTGHSKRLAVGSPGTKVQSNGLGDNTTELTNWSGGKRLRGCSLAHWRCRRCGCNAPCPCRWTGWMQREARSSCTS